MKVSQNTPEVLDVRTDRSLALVLVFCAIAIGTVIAAFTWLDVWVSGRGWYLGAGVTAFVLVCVWIAMGDLDRTRVILDRNMGYASIFFERPFRKPVLRQTALSGVFGVRVRTFEANDAIVHEPILGLDDGQEWPLYQTRHASVAESMANIINDWLRVKQ